MLMRDDIKAAVEALLFVSGELVTRQELQDLLELPESTLMEIMQELMGEFSGSRRGIQILAVDEGYIMSTKPEYAAVVAKLLKPASRRLSSASLETLAIVAYRQPVSKTEIEQIRGVKSERVIANLMEKGIIREIGRREGLGRAVLFGTTHEFLRLFGLTSLTELPLLEEKGEDKSV